LQGRCRLQPSHLFIAVGAEQFRCAQGDLGYGVRHLEAVFHSQAGALEGAGGIVSVHAEDDEIVQYNYARFQADGTTDARYMHLVQSTLSEPCHIGWDSEAEPYGRLGH
jgi:hypothetical protein